MKTKIGLHLFLNHLRDAVMITEPDGTPLFKNSAFDGLFIRGKKEEKSENIFELFKGNSLIIGTIKKAAEHHGNYYLRDIPIKLANRTEIKMDVEAFPLVDEKENLLALNLIFHDRPDSANIEAHQKRLDHIQYLKTVAVGLAHEIKNPLSGIKGASQLLAASLKEDKELSEYPEIIQKEVVRVDKLLKDLVHFTKPRKLTKKKTNVNQILHELVLLQKTVAPKEIEFLEQFDPSLPSIQADHAALSQVFLNLIKNARQAIEGKGVVTLVSSVVTDFILKKGAKKRQLIEVAIKDSGNGINADEIPNIFVPFFTTRPKGIGLGLSVCQQLIEEHEGDIRVKSEKGKGTVFSVYLPV